MIKRFDIRIDNNKPSIIYDNMVVSNNTIIYRNWTVRVTEKEIICNCNSKVNKSAYTKIITFNEGSIFLVNTPIDAYMYFRHKRVQEFLDKYSINKIGHLNEKNNLNVTIKHVYDNHDNIVSKDQFKKDFPDLIYPCRDNIKIYGVNINKVDKLEVSSAYTSELDKIGYYIKTYLYKINTSDYLVTESIRNSDNTLYRILFLPNRVSINDLIKNTDNLILNKLEI